MTGGLEPSLTPTSDLQGWERGQGLSPFSSDQQPNQLCPCYEVSKETPKDGVWSMGRWTRGVPGRARELRALPPPRLQAAPELEPLIIS